MKVTTAGVTSLHSFITLHRLSPVTRSSLYFWMNTHLWSEIREKSFLGFAFFQFPPKVAATLKQFQLCGEISLCSRIVPPHVQINASCKTHLTSSNKPLPNFVKRMLINNDLFELITLTNFITTYYHPEISDPTCSTTMLATFILHRNATPLDISIVF